jgi:hypothetical protein
MPDAPLRLLGSYATPAYHIGQRVVCALRGEVEVVGLSDAPVRWPIGRKPPRGKRFLIVCAGLVEAVKRESAQAVCFWWGVGRDTIWRWRKALGVARPPLTPELILAWADDHHRRFGQWPGSGSGRVRANPAEKWSAIDDALKKGCRGLPGGDSLAKLLSRQRGRPTASTLPRLSERHP